MRWCYTNDIRDDFGKGVHRDILIVPHGTKVEKNPGGAPILTNKRPHFIWDPNGGKDRNGQYVPERKNGQIVYDEMDWVITNDDIIKEKFKYSHSLNSEDNLTFSSCNAAMIQFTIRNKKEFIHDIDPETGEELDTGYWEQEIPNLQNYEYVEKDPNGNTRKIVGEIVSDYCIEVFMYFNGDSDTLMYLGMFKVDEDKLVDDGYNRQITAYDFLAWFRELDIFNWYKHLFEGINKLQSDYDDMTNEKDEEEKEKPKGWDKSWVREPKEKWTIKEALEDIINNLAAYDMITWLKDETEIDPDTGQPVKKPQVGNTTSNPSPYGRDDYAEGNGYTGLGMPIIIDQDILTKGSKPYTPKEPGEGEYERYGYMDILDLEFYQDPKIMKNESLSMGKFLQDIGILAGRYPYIRSDRFEDGYYVDPEDHTYGEFDNRYQNYERCILTFKPLPSAEDDEDSKGNTNLQPEQQFDNSEIVKGFQHDYYQVESMLVIQIGFDDGNVIKYQKLTKDQKNAAKINALQTYSFSDNMFCSYLVSKSDDDTIKEMLPKYKTIREKLFGTETGNDNISSDALFQQAYKNIRNRIYTPCQLQTYADPVREVGDRILVNFTDAITGEKSRFYTYILEREMNGIQKMMDTYTAKGSMKNPTFSNYQSSSKNKTNNGNQNGGNSNTSIMTPGDLVEYMRNCGYRMLDEPSDCEAVFVKGTEQDDGGETHIFNNLSANPYYAPDEYYPKDGDITNPYKHCTDWGVDYAYYEDVTANIGDYVQNLNYDSSDNPDPAVLDATGSPLYVWSANSKWEYVGSSTSEYSGGNSGCNWYNCSGVDIKLDEGDGSFTEGSTCNKIILSPKQGENSFNKSYLNSNHSYAAYGYQYDVVETINEIITVDVHCGDNATLINQEQYYEEWHYQYPGVWVKGIYPQLDIPIIIKTKPHVLLKWSDPPNITDWEPTPCNWEGTVVIRKEDSPPMHRWDGIKIVGNKRRDKYKTKGFKDEDIKMGRTYYYGFFPYYTADDSDPNHPLRYYRFTKVIKVETGDNSLAPVITSITVDGNSATINYSISEPDGSSFASVKLYGKIGSSPACDNTDDIIEDVDPTLTSITCTGLDYETTYYFAIITTSENDEELTSNVEKCEIGEVVIPEEYQVYVDKLILTSWGSSDQLTLLSYSCLSGNSNTYNIDNIYSYYVQDGNFNNDSNAYDFYILSNCIINVTSGSNITVTYDISMPPNDLVTVSGRSMWGPYSYTGNYTGSQYGYIGSTFGNRTGVSILGATSNFTGNPTTTFNSMLTCMQYLSQHFRHVNLIVDGNTWIDIN